MDSPNLSALRTAASTPTSSPGLYSPSQHLTQIRNFSSLSDGTPAGSPYLHPLQMHRVKETHKAAIEQDFITGRKLINQYEILNELGRGMHGKVKLARSLENGEYVAIKIIQRFSKKRRLGKVMVSPEKKTKREIAILKKIRHPNVVGLLEVIDDPELKKIYMVLEHVELGEVAWRRKGTKEICAFERHRIERELRGDFGAGDEEERFNALSLQRLRREAKLNKQRQNQLQIQTGDYWSLEHGDDGEDDIYDLAPLSRIPTRESIFKPRSYTSHTSMIRSNPPSRAQSRATSRAPSPSRSSSSARMPTESADFDIGPQDSDDEDELETPGPLPFLPSTHSSGAGLHAQLHSIHSDDIPQRGRSPSTADSIISHMSSIDDMVQHDQYSDDFSYVPCFTLEQARSAFRDTVLGLEYLHYEGVVHRDIKPANLLWTADHRVKISDFGVSYFGKPTRDGELEDVSESDAKDFDNELELAKTVGTPAFFAPELCYTDEQKIQPKVTEQIDVWSLGVTLYCLVYARVPFLADDEWQLFRTIATEDVYIPRRRLLPVNPSVSNPTGFSTPVPPQGCYRDDNKLVMETIDDELHDLLRRMLMKQPAERMTLREVKRHPWVIKGIDNLIGWLDDTDPSRKASGRRIQVDDRELERAVVPITFLERARSAVKKAVGKVIGRSEGSRKRAVSSATSSNGEGSVLHSPSTSARDDRRASLRGDEPSYFAHLTDHPLSQSVTVSPERQGNRSDPFAEQFSVDQVTPPFMKQAEALDAKATRRPPLPERAVSTTASVKTVVYGGHTRSRSLIPSPPLEESSHEDAAAALENYPTFTDHIGGIIRDTSRPRLNTRSMEISNDAGEGLISRAHSADRALFTSENKHSEASVGISNVSASRMVELPKLAERHQHDYRSTETSLTNPVTPEHHPGFFRGSILAANQHQSMSSPNFTMSVPSASDPEERPATANRIPGGQTPAPRVYSPSTPESFSRAQHQLIRRQKLETEAENERQEMIRAQHPVGVPEAASDDCPPSPDDDIFIRKQEEQAKQTKSSSSINSYRVTSTTHSPSNFTSPISSVTLGSSQEQFFASDPSLPTLISGATSVSGDPEGEFLKHPGMVQGHDTPETITPPAISKQISHGTNNSAPSTIGIGKEGEYEDEEGYNADGDRALVTSADEDDSDSDEGLTMGRRKPHPKPSSPGTSKRGALERRDTNASVGSTGTAKKVSMAD